jgi:hypothetical protein
VLVLISRKPDLPGLCCLEDICSQAGMASRAQSLPNTPAIAASWGVGPEQAGPDAVKVALMVVAKAHNMLLNCGTAAGVSTPHPAGSAVGPVHRVKAQFAGAVDAVYRAGHWPALVTVSFIVSAPRAMIALDLKLGGIEVSGRHLVLVIDVPA